MAASSSTSSPPAATAGSSRAGEEVEAPSPSPGGDADGAWTHHALLLLFTFLWGSNFVLAEVAIAEMSPISFSVARFGMGALGLLVLLYAECRVNGERSHLIAGLFPPIRRRDWPRLLLIAVFGATLAPWLGIEGLNLTYAGRAAFWLALAPVLSAAIGAVLQTERIGRLGHVGLVVAGLGAVGLALDGLAPERGYWLGDLLLAAAIVMTVTELHLIKPLAARYGATPMVTARTVIGGLLYTLVATPSLVQQPWLELTFWVWVAIVAGGVIGVGLGQWVKVRALRTIGPTQVVIYGNMVPLATILIAWVTIGTPTTPLEIVAGLMIVVGAICLQLGGAPIHESDAPMA